MIFLDLDDLLHVIERAIGTDPQVRDAGLLLSALARPQMTVGDHDAYPTIHGKAAALLHSLARNHGLVDGNKRMSLAGCIAFYGLNGYRLTLDNDGAYDLVVRVSAGELDDVQALAAVRTMRGWLLWTLKGRSWALHCGRQALTRPRRW